MTCNSQNFHNNFNKFRSAALQVALLNAVTASGCYMLIAICNQ